MAKTLYQINTFDDGNAKYQNYPNEWVIVGYPNHGKVRLQNMHQSEIIIPSISLWKITQLSSQV